jgi:hypothetical protein
MEQIPKSTRKTADYKSFVIQQIAQCNPNHPESMKSNQTFAVSSEERAAQIKLLKYHAKSRGYQCSQIIFLYGNQTYNQLLQIQNVKATVAATVLFTLIFYKALFHS